MSAALIQLLSILLPALIQGIPSAVAAGQALFAMLKSGTPPTDQQCIDMATELQADEAVAAAAIAAAEKAAAAG
ncbi:MAG TPA: hypothetical protein VNX47_05855 [Nevskia sp.]|jgi:hypothetical protein|nr:hypothetical protein [Nevskia sp.]